MLGKMKSLKFTLSGEQLWICDMRPGISQDGIRVTLPAGEYLCEIARADKGRVSAISYVRHNALPNSESRIGEVSLDMARVGVVELKPLLARHTGDWDALADWSDELADRREKTWGGTLLPTGHHAAFFTIGTDCTLDVFKLRQGRQDVGMVLRPRLLESVEAKPRRWTWVEVKWRGIGDPWSHCDDWAFPRDDERFFTDVDFELSYFTEGKIDHDKPLPEYSSKFRHIEWIKVFVEDSGSPRRQVTRKIDIPTIKSPLTARGLAAVVLEVFEKARKNA